MKKKHLYLILITATIFSACKKHDYADGQLSPIIAVSDLKMLYKGADVALSSENMLGATEIVGVVISDATSGNAPAGVLVVQNFRRNVLRGIGVTIGDAAKNYIPGDSVKIQLSGAILTRVNGSMRVNGLSATAVTKVSAGSPQKVQAINSAVLLAAPDTYEYTLVTVSKAVTEPEPVTDEKYVGDKLLNDGFGKIGLHTETTAAFAGTDLPFSGNFTGIPVINSAGTQKLQVWMRTIDDVLVLAATKPSAAIITGYLVDPKVDDDNYEYIQFLATKDIDFAATPFSVITTNNAGATNPFPVAGWATGGVRTYKFNLTSGSVTKGQYFYVGGTNKLICGAGSTDISSSKWIASVNYTNTPGADGIGAVTKNLLANSGNAAGIAIFLGTTVDASTVPIDVIMYGGTGGNFYTAGPPEAGYRVTSTDYYSLINPVTRAAQNYYGAGSNTARLGFPTAINFAQLGGVYDAQTGRWTTGRTLTSVPVIPTAPISTIEGGTIVTSN